MSKSHHAGFFIFLSSFFALSFVSANAFAAQAAAPPITEALAAKGTSLWQLIQAGGVTMIFLGILSTAAVASIIYHFRQVTPEKLTPRDFSETLLYLLEKKEHQKAATLCKEQTNITAQIVSKGLAALPKGRSVVEEAIQYEGKAKIEKLWRNLSYLGDIAVVAPMLGLLGTVLGMIDAFNYQAFKAGIIKPVLLAQGLAKAMITTAFGLIIAVPILVFYSYFRGRIGMIASNAERSSTEVLRLLASDAKEKEEILS
jgi:biopolymer transport protein ExbB